MRLFERYKRSRRQRDTLWYHGTGGDRVPSVLSQGLTDRVRKKAWADDEEKLSADHVSRASYGGVYLTKNLITATGSASRALLATGRSRETHGAGLFFVKAHPKSLAHDEDNIPKRVLDVNTPHGLVTNPGGHVLDLYAKHFSPHSKATQAEKDADAEEYANRHAPSIGQALAKNKRAEKNAHRILKTHGFHAALRRAAAHVDKYHRERWEDYHEYQTGHRGAPDLPSPEEAERGYRSVVDKLTKSIGPHSGHNRDQFNHARSLSPIGFSGKKRIVGAVTLTRTTRGEYADALKQFRKKWTGSPGLKRKYARPSRYADVITPVYGKVPLSFWRDHAERIGNIALVRTQGRVRPVVLRKNKA